jgi:hypothetical protein
MFGTKNGDTAYWIAPEGTNILFKLWNSKENHEESFECRTAMYQ